MVRHDWLGRVQWELSRPGRLRSRQRGFDGDMYDKLVQRLDLGESASLRRDLEDVICILDGKARR